MGSHKGNRLSRLKSGEKRSFCFLSVDTVGSSIMRGAKRKKQETFVYLSNSIKKIIEKYRGKIINWGLDGGSAVFLDCKDHNVYSHATLAGIEIIFLLPFFNRYLNLLKDPLTLRVNLHCGEGIWNDDPSLFSSDEFSNFIKFEREFGEPGKLVISKLVCDELDEEIQADFMKTTRRYNDMELYTYSADFCKILADNQNKTFVFLEHIKAKERDKILKNFEKPMIDTSIDEEKEAKSYLKEGFESLGKQDYREAFKSFSTVVGLSPRCREAWYGRGKAIYMMGDKEESVNSIRKALDIDPHYKEALSLLREIKEE